MASTSSFNVRENTDISEIQTGIVRVERVHTDQNATTIGICSFVEMPVSILAPF